MHEGDKRRIERDFGGEVSVPSDMLYGAQTQRAVEHFTMSGLLLSRRFVRVLGAIKLEAAEANHDLGLIDSTIRDAIVSAAGEVVRGELDRHFVVDVFQTGSGTNTNMNANEVIANRANQLLGAELGTKSPVHPNDHVNKGQSSNDVIPTAIHLTALVCLEEEFFPALEHLRSTLEAKAREFDEVLKTGRTHLQDATPIRLGQEFAGYAGQIERSVDRVRSATGGLSELALGGTAVGTGINTHPDFAARVCDQLTRRFGIEVRETTNHFQAQSTMDAVVFASGALRTVAVSLLKICNDLRWMSSGPRTGLAEISLPRIPMGSSIMPGKTNPVIAESVCQVAAKVVGNDATIVLGGQHGSFEINVMMPVMAYCLNESLDLLSAASVALANLCVSGITANSNGPSMVERSLMMATALSPVVGYDRASELAEEAAKTGRSVREVARADGQIPDEVLDSLLDARKMTGDLT